MIAFYRQTKIPINFYVLILQRRQVFNMFIVSMSQGLENVMFLITNWRKCTFSTYILHFFHFGPYILFLLLLVSKPINA